MTSIRQIVYVSTALPKLTNAMLDDLLEQSRTANERNDVTGLLVYADGSIMQLIEGAPDTIGRLFSTISSDPRHTSIIVIHDGETDCRALPGWRMAYEHAPHAEKIDQCVRLFQSNETLREELSGKGVVGRVLSNFIGRLT